MKIDNSAMKAWWFCPMYWYERYIKGITLDRDTDALDTGTRGHELLEEYYKGKELYPVGSDPVREAKLSETLAAYKQFYGTEKLGVADVERYFEVPLGDKHIYNGKIDIVATGEDGKLFLMDHKFERRGAKSNHPKSWAARSQASLYIWAAEQLYNCAINRLDVNVITLPSVEYGPMFERMVQYRDEKDKADAVNNLMYVADQMESMLATGFIPSDKNNCHTGWMKCEYYDLHIFDGNQDTSEIEKSKYVQVKPYLDL